ncbi:unnamed protein product [Dicrocoelium dendriticum]|nr:unnamed protein product [Dicrocoelium dendriticum]
MSGSLIAPSNRATKTRNSSIPRNASPAFGTQSEAGFSATHSVKSTASKASRASTYPKKGTTLGNIQLTKAEQDHLHEVLARFDQFRYNEEMRIRNLRDELVEKQKVRIRNAEASGDGHCYSCGRLFMAVFNAPMECCICKHEFCRMCLEKMANSKQLICKFCRFESVYRGRLGIWFTEELKQARAAGRVRGVSGPEALRTSLLRIKRKLSSVPIYRQSCNPRMSTLAFLNFVFNLVYS